MTRSEFLTWLETLAEEGEGDGQPLFYPNLKDAIIGIVERFDMLPVVLYDREKVIQILMTDGIDEATAEKWFVSNILEIWSGGRTPAFATLIQEEADGN